MDFELNRDLGRSTITKKMLITAPQENIQIITGLLSEIQEKIASTIQIIAKITSTIRLIFLPFTVSLFPIRLSPSNPILPQS